MPSKPSVLIAGAGAAGLWCALALLDLGWTADELQVVEPDEKSGNDHTYGYWAKAPLIPEKLHAAIYDEIILRNEGQFWRKPIAPFRYFSLRSSAFYAFAKTRLAAAGIQWTRQAVAGFRESAQQVTTVLDDGTELATNYALDSRPGKIDLNNPDYNAALQHFGGWFIATDEELFEPGCATFMDFDKGHGEVAFFYVMPYGPKEALVELALFGPRPWTEDRYRDALRQYLSTRFGLVEGQFRIVEEEFGVIPMTDEPLWRQSTDRVWKIGAAGGWVQPSSGYAFARCAAFSKDVAKRLNADSPRPWTPSPIQQVFNSTMLGYILDHPEKGGDVFLRLFQRNGAARTFEFLNEEASLTDTLSLMWNSPRTPFTLRAMEETWLRIRGKK